MSSPQVSEGTGSEPPLDVAEQLAALGADCERPPASEQMWLEALDAEQRCLSQLLHDTLTQSLNAARIYARISRNTLERSGPDAATALLTLETVIQNAADDLQSLTRWLRPARLDGTDLPTALAELAQLVSRTLPCELRCALTGIEADAETQARQLRVAQLALHGLLRHCRVEAIGVELELDQQHLILVLQASGGLPLPDDRARLLELRARASGGSFSVRFDAERGSTLTCLLPRRR